MDFRLGVRAEDGSMIQNELYLPQAEKGMVSINPIGLYLPPSGKRK